jgi:hypothetical protein
MDRCRREGFAQSVVVAVTHVGAPHERSTDGRHEVDVLKQFEQTYAR